MKYDSIIIGGGLAGLTCAIRCAEAGLKTVVIAAGDSSLTFSSGSIDVMGIRQNNSVVQYPFEEINQLPSGHPYHKLGTDKLKQALTFFKEQLSVAGLEMEDHGQQNHSRLTALGALRPSWLSQTSAKAMSVVAPAAGLRQVAVINIAGFRDFQPALVAAGMKKHPEFNDVELKIADIKAETLNMQARNVYELRSLEMARVLKRDLFTRANGVNILASALRKAAGNADLVVIPAVISRENSNKLIKQLEQQTGLRICELATLPPSLPGMRLADALKKRFRELGGLLLEGDEVTSGQFNDGQLTSVATRLNPHTPLIARHFVMATGSFFSRGLDSDKTALSENTFGLDAVDAAKRPDWANDRFLNGRQHGFGHFGVLTDDNLHPYKNNQAIGNLFCAGAVLGGFNPVAEASAGGVSIGTGWFAAEQMISRQSGDLLTGEE